MAATPQHVERVGDAERRTSRVTSRGESLPRKTLAEPRLEALDVDEVIRYLQRRSASDVGHGRSGPRVGQKLAQDHFHVGRIAGHVRRGGAAMPALGDGEDAPEDSMTWPVTSADGGDASHVTIGATQRGSKLRVCRPATAEVLGHPRERAGGDGVHRDAVAGELRRRRSA